MRPCYARRTRDTRLTASNKGQKREAFLQIVRSGHRQRKCAQGAQCKAQCASITCCRGRVAMRMNSLALLLRQSLIRLPTNLGRVTKKRRSNECLFFATTDVAHFQCAHALRGELGKPDINRYAGLQTPKSRVSHLVCLDKNRNMQYNF